MRIVRAPFAAARLDEVLPLVLHHAYPLHSKEHVVRDYLGDPLRNAAAPQTMGKSGLQPLHREETKIVGNKPAFELSTARTTASHFRVSGGEGLDL